MNGALSEDKASFDQLFMSEDCEEESRGKGGNYCLLTRKSIQSVRWILTLFQIILSNGQLLVTKSAIVLRSLTEVLIGYVNLKLSDMERMTWFYLKMIYYWYTFIAIVFLWPLFLFVPAGVHNLKLILGLVSILTQVLGIDVLIKGREHLLTLCDESCVIICNHQTSLDMIPISKVFPENCTIMAKSFFKYFIPLGPLSYKSGMVYIDRSNPQKSWETIQWLSKVMRSQKLKVWIFPEGTRNSSHKLLPFKKGAFHLAIKAQVPIVPIVISSYKPFYSKPNKIFEKGQLIVTCLPAVPTLGKSLVDIDELVEKIRKDMQDTYDSVSNYD